MQFLYPSFLWSLFALVVPVVIHLFYFRRFRKVVFSDIRFLKEITEVNRSSRKIKDWLILACRLLSLAGLVLAFAQPVLRIGEANEPPSSQIAIYIDNSISMLNEGREGTLLDEAKSVARTIAEAYPSGTRFELFTNTTVNTTPITRIEFLQRLDEIKPVPVQRNIASLQSTLLRSNSGLSEKTSQVYVISDIQKGAVFNSGFEPDSAFRFHIMRLEALSFQNIGIDSAWLANPMVRKGVPVQLRVRLHNYGEQHQEHIPVQLKVNNVQKAVAAADLTAGSRKDISMSYTPDQQEWQLGELSIMDHPVTFDDHLFLAFRQHKAGHVLHVNDHAAHPFLKVLFEGDQDFVYTTVKTNAINYGTLDQNDLIVLDAIEDIPSGLASELVKYVIEGGQLIIFPSSSGSNQGANSLLSSFGSLTFGEVSEGDFRVEKLNLADPFFRDVFTRIPASPDFPEVQKYFVPSRNSTTRGKALISLNTGDPFAWYNSAGEGHVVVCTVPLDLSFSSFPRNALFVPFMIKMAMGAHRLYQVYVTEGQQKFWPAGSDAMGRKLFTLTKAKESLNGELTKRGEKSGITLPPAQMSAGWWSVSYDRSNVISDYIAMNENRSESETKSELESVLRQWPGRVDMQAADHQLMGYSIREATNGKPLWRWFLAATLCFLILEIIIHKFWKVQRPINSQHKAA